jgi:hypothetical protein
MKKYFTHCILLILSTLLTPDLYSQQSSALENPAEHTHDSPEQFVCGLDAKGIEVLNAHREKAIIKKFGSIENWKAYCNRSKTAQIQMRAATCNLNTEIVKLGNANNIPVTELNKYAAEFGDMGGEFNHPTNVVVVANSVVMNDLYTLFPTSLSYVPTAGTAGEYYIESGSALFDDLPLWTGYASNQTNQTIVVVPATWAGPNGTKPIRIRFNGANFGGVNPLGSADGSYPRLGTDKSNLDHGFMLITGTTPGFVLIHETGHGLGFNHYNSMVNYMGTGANVATQFIPAHRVVGDISLQIAGPSGTNGSNGFGFFTSQCNSIVLPVELLNFTGNLNKNDKITLNWRTASEQNTDGFDIEQSTDAKTFEKIGTVKARGSNSTYIFTDEQILKNTTYYRLKISDFGGRTSYSKVLSFNASNASKVRVYPTYTEGVLFIDNARSFEILNTVGQVVSTVADIRQLASGMYFVRGVDMNGAFFLEKVFKH